MRALAFGEILWDIIDNEEYIGGAPFNCAAHLAQMGAESAIVSALGEDARGSKALVEMERLNIRTDFISRSSNLPTGTVNVSLDHQGKPEYDIREGSAWDAVHLEPEQKKALGKEEWDVVIFGSLAQRTEGNRKILREVIETAAPREVFFDVNLRLDYYSRNIITESLRMATILKLNDEEAPLISEMLYGEVLPDQTFCEKMEMDWSIPTTVLTRGKDGASVYRRDHYIHVPVVDVRVVDTVGAGDSFSAAFLYGYFMTGEIEQGARLAAEVSSFVASRNGAVPSYSKEIQSILAKVPAEN